MPADRAPLPKSVDDYLARLPPEPRAALERIRATIRAAAPHAEELISYGHPAFRQERMRVNYAAFSDHLSFFGWARVRERFSKEIAPFESQRGTLRFTVERPLPLDLIARIVKALVELDAPARSG